MTKSPVNIQVESPFLFQIEKQPVLTEQHIKDHNITTDYFGRPFQPGDQILHVTLLEKTGCCGFATKYVQLHKDSIPTLELDYMFSHVKMGIPRYSSKDL